MSELSQRKIPVQPSERIVFVDVLRGFAVFGILVANMASYSGHIYDISNQGDLLDYAVLVLIRFFVTAKFYSLFSFLFGWGMSVQMNRSSERGQKFTHLYLRRLAILLLLGIAHGVFIWTGDILTLYAILGILLLLLRNRSEKFLIAILVLSLLIAVIVRAPGDTMTAFRALYENMTSFLRHDTYAESLYSTGTYKQITQLRLQEFLKGNSWILFYFGNVFAMFVMGLIIGKRKVFQELDHHLSLIRKVFWIALVLGVLFNGLFVWMDINPAWRVSSWIPSYYNQMIQRMFYSIGAPAMMLFYCAGIILLFQKYSWRQHLTQLGNVGRMALSNYLLQSIIFTLIFYNYGLGIYGEISPTFGLILTTGFFILQIRFSRWWFNRFRFGPMEWIWRTLTYGKVQHITHSKSGFYTESSQSKQILSQPTIRRYRTAGLVIFATFVLIFIGLITHRRANSEIFKKDNIITFTSKLASIPSLSGPGSTDSPDEVTTNLSTLNPIQNKIPTYNDRVIFSNDILPLFDSFNVINARIQIEILTSQPFLGRQAGSPAGYATGEYIAQQYEKIGLLPFGEDGTYFQNFPVNYTPLNTIPTFQIEKPDSTRADSYEIYKDYTPIIRWYAGDGSSHSSVYWVDTCSRDNFAEIDVVGKVVLCKPGNHQDWLVEILRNAVEHGASGLLIVGDSSKRPPDFASPSKEFWLPETIPAFWVYQDIIEDLLADSGKTLEDLLSSNETLSLETQVNLNVSINVSDHCPGSNCLARNVLGIIPGTDPEVAHELIILGAHYDHMGQGPDGTVWRGANDNASGVAVLLEIARSWQEHNYKPRRSILFAAWDAEELGLLGARHYIQSPVYPLQNTLAMIQLDMVGAGGEVLSIDGHSELSEHVQRVAQWIEIPTNLTQLGGSDHTPFLESGIPSSLLIWESDNNIHYHQPEDNMEVIEPDKLEKVAKVVQVTVLDIAESHPAIVDLLSRRAKAAESGNLELFLTTSTDEQENYDSIWLNDLLSLSPTSVEFETKDLIIFGTQATASLNIKVEYLEPGSEPITNTINAQFPARFSLESNGWKFDGPDLQWQKANNISEGSALTIGMPSGVDASSDDIAQIFQKQYEDIAKTLDLPTGFTTKLRLLPDVGSLQSSTALSLLDKQEYWVSPGTMMLVYTENNTSSQRLNDSVVKLVLADNGITEDAAPWLWHGLPAIFQARSKPIAVQQKYLPDLEESLISGYSTNDLASSWAATDFLFRQLGWSGLGEFINRLGQICQDNGCNDPGSLDSLLLETIKLDSEGFENAWRNEWISRFDYANNAIEQVLSDRSKAIDNLDERLFLSTVDINTPNLIEEERNWFNDLKKSPITLYEQNAQPLAFLADGSILAEVVVSYSQDNSSDSVGVSYSLKILFTKDDAGHKWSGPLFDQLIGDVVDVRYPIGEDELAHQLLSLSEDIYPKLANTLNIEHPDKVVLTLYQTSDDFSQSISLYFPRSDSAVAWTNKGNNIKLKTLPALSSQDYIPILVTQLSRNLLYQNGITNEWLIDGLSSHQTNAYDQGRMFKLMGRTMPKLREAFQIGALLRLNQIKPIYSDSEENISISRSQSWDAVDFLVTTYGWPNVLEIIYHQSHGLDIESAFQQSIGTSLDAFEENWRSSLINNHLDEDHIQIALEFDHKQSFEHVQYLTKPELAGRQSGSPGDRMAANYIAEKFAEFGLTPVGDSVVGTDSNKVYDQGKLFLKSVVTDTHSTYYQTFPISITLPTTEPKLEIANSATNSVKNLKFRQDYVIIQSSTEPGIVNSANIVWVGSEGYEGTNLQGDFALRFPVNDLYEEILEAEYHGAGGLIIISSRNRDSGIYQKSLQLHDLSMENTFPVFEITFEGFQEILESSGFDQKSLREFKGIHPLGLRLKSRENIILPKSGKTTNILGLLPGSDPLLKHEIIIIGAHYDHVGDDPDGTRYSGANDNASGIATLLEIARLWQNMGYKPKRSVLFAAWGAQEMGNLGSEFYVNQPVFPLESTIAALHLDGVGGGEGFNLGAQAVWESDAILLDNLGIAESALGEKIVVTEPYSYSDHLSFQIEGIPSILLSWRLANEENLPDYLTNSVNPDRLRISGRVTSLLLMNLGR